MNTNNKEKSPPVTAKIDNSGVDSSRRKIAKAGVMVPVLMSLSSRPAWAINCTVSGNMSGNASDPAYDAACGLPGMSPAYWADPINSTQWCGPGFSQTYSFNDAIAAVDPSITVFDTAVPPSLLTVLTSSPAIDSTLANRCKDGSTNNDAEVVELAQLTVAGWQNALALGNASPPYPFTTGQVTNIFLTGIANGNGSCGSTSLQLAIDTLKNENNP